MADAGLTSSSREICLSLIKRLTPPQLKNPPPPNRSKVIRVMGKTEKIDLKPVPAEDLPVVGTSSRVPDVLWWECRKYLMIQILIPDSKLMKPSSKLSATPNKDGLNFRCGQFKFHLSPLYGRIVAQNSLKKVTNREVKYALCKECPGLWSKLMRAGHKTPSFVRPNMDLMIDSSDDDDYEDHFESPFHIIPRAHEPFSALRGTHSSLPSGIPADIYESGSETDTDQDDDVRFDRSEQTT